MQLKRARVRGFGRAAALVSLACEAGGGLRVETPAPPDRPSLDTGAPSETEADASGLDPTGLSDATDVDGSGGESGGGADGAHAMLVADGALWRMSTAAGSGWTDPSFDASGWTEHRAPIVDGRDADGAAIGAAGTTYWRHAFDVGAIAPLGVLELRLRRDDGAVVFLNGVEIARSNLPLGELSADVPAEDDVTGAEGHTYFHAVHGPEALRVGANALAVELHQSTDLDASFDARLRHVEAPGTAGAAQIQYRTTSYGGEYGPRHAAVAWIESVDHGYVRTLGLWADERREHLVRWVEAGGLDAPDAIASASPSSHGSRLLEWDLADTTGRPVAAGTYSVRLEFTEANSSAGAVPGPSLDISLQLGEAAEVVAPVASDRFRDLLVIVPARNSP